MAASLRPYAGGDAALFVGTSCIAVVRLRLRDIRISAVRHHPRFRRVSPSLRENEVKAAAADLK